MFCKWIIIINFTAGTLMAGIFAAGCFNKNASGKDVDLLTGTPWRYEKAGFDNDDGTFDALDPRIAGNEKDNTIIFCKDGTGYSEFSRKTRKDNPDSLPFIWAFQNGDSTIYFEDTYYKVRELSPNRFEIYADQHIGGTSTRYTIVFKH
jgi:hypothetical protein